MLETVLDPFRSQDLDRDFGTGIMDRAGADIFLDTSLLEAREECLAGVWLKEVSGSSNSSWIARHCSWGTGFLLGFFLKEMSGEKVAPIFSSMWSNSESGREEVLPSEPPHTGAT